MKWLWQWTEQPLGVVEYIRRNGWGVYDVDWWEKWQEYHEMGSPYPGWREVDSSTSVYTELLNISMDYKRYSEWWNRESTRPRGVSDGAYGGGRE